MKNRPIICNPKKMDYWLKIVNINDFFGYKNNRHFLRNAFSSVVKNLF